MRNQFIYILILIGVPLLSLSAQVRCDSRLDSLSMISNDYRQVSTSNLSSFHTGHYGQEDFYLDGDGVTGLFQLGFNKGIWAGGYDLNGNLKLASSLYDTGGCDFTTGPIWLDYQGTTDLTEFFKRAWVVTNTEVQLMLDIFDNGSLSVSDVPRDILEWPAIGNPHLDFAIEEELAPFFDENQDGIYNPIDGDYPIALVENSRLVPEQFRFYVINDATEHLESGGTPLEMEFHILDYVLSCNQESESEKAVFTRLKYINRSQSVIQDFRIGLWEDTDLGCLETDYIGSVPDLNASYIYNGDGMDQLLCQIDVLVVPREYGVVRSNVFLTRNLESFNYYFYEAQGIPPVPQADPQLPLHFYNYLDGRWITGERMTRGGTGSNEGSTDFTDYVFTDLPNENGGWSMQELINTSYVDYKTISVFEKEDLVVGQIGKVDFADHVLISSELTGLDIFQIYEGSIATLQEEFNSMLAGNLGCNQIEKLVESEVELRLSPNPAQTNLEINFPSVIEEGTLRVVSGQGNLIRTYSLSNDSSYNLSIAGLQPGVYLVMVDSPEHVVISARFVKG